MKNSTQEKKKLAVRLVGYAAAAGAMVALAPSANAQVVWSDIQDETIHLNNSFSLDLNNDGYTDFNFRLIGSKYSTSSWSNGSSTRYYSGRMYGSAYIINPNSYSNFNSWIANSWSYRPYAFSAGGYIYNASYWNHNTYATAYGRLASGNARYSRASFGGTSTYSTYLNGAFRFSDQFIGVRFNIDGELHYGWVRAQLINPNNLNIKDWAYQTLPNTGIIAGGVEPEFVNYTLYNTNIVQVQLNFPIQIQDLDSADFIVTNGAVTDLIEDVVGEQYRVEITADGDGEVNLSLPVYSTQNTEGLFVLGKSTKFTVDTQAPNATIDAGVTSTNTKKITVNVGFDEKIKGLALGDFNITNGSPSNLVPVNDTTYTLDVTATAGGEVDIQLPVSAVTDMAGNGNTVATESYTYVAPVSAENITADDFMMYPNPASGTLYIKLNLEADISFINSAGETVLVKEHFLDNEVDISTLKSGIYIVQIRQEENVIHKKLIVE
jgi:hypothetical protein